MKKFKGHHMSRQGAVFMAVICLFLTLITICVFNGNKPIEKSEAQQLSTTFDYYEFQYGRNHSLQLAILFFENGESKSISGICVNGDLSNTLKAMKKGTALNMLINPTNNYIIELKTDGNELLSFDYAQKKLRQEGIAFLCLSIFLFGCFCLFTYEAIITKEKITVADIKFYWNIIRKR